MAKDKIEPEARYCKECFRRMDRTAGGSLIGCCPLGTNSEAEIGSIVAFEASDGTQYAPSLPALDLPMLLPDTRALLDLFMTQFGGVAWEKDLLGCFRGGFPSFCKAMSAMVFAREGYRVAENDPAAAYRLYVTDLAYDGWVAFNGKPGRKFQGEVR